MLTEDIGMTVAKTKTNKQTQKKSGQSELSVDV